MAVKIEASGKTGTIIDTQKMSVSDVAELRALVERAGLEAWVKWW